MLACKKANQYFEMKTGEIAASLRSSQRRMAV
jgi:hypothetical protein